jgi:Tol biopolymer transport system component
MRKRTLPGWRMKRSQGSFGSYLYALLCLGVAACGGDGPAGPDLDLLLPKVDEGPWELLTGQLVFMVNGAFVGDEALVLLDAEAKTVRAIASGRFLLSPALSPDRTVVAYSYFSRADGWGIWGIPVTERTVICPWNKSCGLPLLDDPNVHELNPAWSSDGRLAYFQADSFYVGGVRAHRDGAVGGCCLGRRAAWAPDGTIVAYLDVYRGTSGTDIISGLYRIDPRSGNTELIISDADAWIVDPAVSPDGAHLAYVRWANEAIAENEVWVANLDGTDARRLVAGSLPVWSPEGGSIAFDGAGGVYVIDASGGQPVLVAEGGNQASWQP